jgi:hypothetical protein
MKVEDRIPDWLAPALTNRDLHTGYAKVIVLTELFIAFGLLWRRTRWAAIAVAVAFHLSIALTADVEVFSILGVAALVIWLDPASSAPRITRVRRAPDSSIAPA